MRRTTWWLVALIAAAPLAVSTAEAKVTIRVATETAQPDPTWELDRDLIDQSVGDPWNRQQ